jgi:hypothetical protein
VPVAVRLAEHPASIQTRGPLCAKRRGKGSHTPHVDRRYQVFVSSTFLDLKEERAAVVSALLQLDAMPAGMELFPAADDDAWTLIERVIDASDYYLLVIGGKYGSIDHETELSYTEREFDYAVAAGKPVMAFLHDNPDAIPSGKTERTEEAQAKLDSFRKKVQARKHVKYWNNADSLQGRVAMSFASFTKTYPAVGWIRGDVETAAGALAEINDLRKQLDVARAQLAATRVSPPPGVEGLAQGDDPIKLTVKATTQVRSAKRDEYGDWDWTIWSGAYEIAPTWNELFSALGPSLLDEAEQRALHRHADGWLARRFGPGFRAVVRTRANKKTEQIEGFRRTTLLLSDDDFGTLVVQLKALGLIQRSDRKRSVSDKGAYWTLTPYGDTHLTTLRAIHRTGDAVHPDAEDLAPDEEEEEEQEGDDE